MKGVATKDRQATTDEGKAFYARLQAILDATKRRLARYNDNHYELRVMTIRTHDVRAHTRKTFQKVYLAKKITKRGGRSAHP